MRERVGLLLVAFQRLPRRRPVGRARGRGARLAGVGPQVRREVRGVPPARRVLRIDPVSGAQADARAGHTRLHAKPRKRTAIPDPKAEPRPDLVRRDFTSPVPTCRLAGDITYLRTGEGRLHLATAIDLNTRMVVGWSLSGRMTADIAVAAPESAKSRGYAAGNAIFHTDRGAQHASRLPAEWARANDVRLSCGRTGSCRDSAVAESFFATLKNEMHCRRRFATGAEAGRAVVEFIEAYHSRRRPHSSIGCRVPAEAMADFFERTDPKPAFFERPDPKPDAMPMAA